MVAMMPPVPKQLSGSNNKIREFLKSGQKTRRELIALGNEDLVDKALYKMVQVGELRRVTRGVYELVSSESPNLRGIDSEETLAEDEGEV